MKTTGESSIPKFLFLVFLGHPTPHVPFCQFKCSQHEPDPQQNDKSTSTGKGKAAFHVKSEEKELDVVDDDLIAKGLL